MDPVISNDDGARFSPLLSKSKRYCRVDGCSSKAYADPSLRFHSFPVPEKNFVDITNKFGDKERVDQRKAWEISLRIGSRMARKITKATYICSLHFKKDDYILPDDLGSETKLVLVNAVYFNGEWVKEFNPLLTQDRPFHIDERTTRSVPTMHITSRFRNGYLPQLGARFIEIPYQGNQFSMIIILPNEVNGLRTVLNNFSQVNLNTSLQDTSPHEINLFLPKFKIESTLKLQETLEKLGMTDMFTDRADFSGIADAPLKISKVIQKAFIEVNEVGSEAAAATGSTFEPRISSITFKVDRPYYYAIYHRDTGISLFTGIVEQPNVA